MGGQQSGALKSPPVSVDPTCVIRSRVSSKVEDTARSAADVVSLSTSVRCLTRSTLWYS